MLLFETAGAEGQKRLPIEMIGAGERVVSLLDFARDTHYEAMEVAAATNDDEALQEMEAGAERLRVMIEAARAEVAAEVKAAMEVEMQARLREERVRVERLSKEFARDRERYFTAAETQVVRLAMAVAERVLCREVEKDGMFLGGIVRAALARVADDGAATLRVRHEDVEVWQEMFPAGGANVVTVIGQDEIEAGECVLETGVGRVELGVRPQMAEIERGFAELLQRC